MKNYLFLLFLVPVIVSAQGKFTVYFDFDIAEVNTMSGESLTQWLADNKDAEVLTIHGYADAVGDATYNQDLSERRAAYVHGRIKMAGLNVANVHEEGFGETKAVSANRAKDRKVELTYVKAKPAPPAQLTTAVTGAKKGDKLRLPKLNFYNNSDIVLPESQPVLRELLTIMQENPNLKIDIQGHVCCMKVDINDIAIKRAKAVYEYLKRNNVSADRISYQGFGSSRPIHQLPEKSEEERVTNRRVEIEILEN